MVDRYSGFLFVARLLSPTTEAVCNVMLRWFCDYGFPRSVKSDGGPQFRQPFKDFCAVYGIVHHTSSPYNPRSTGLAEAGVKAMKYLLKKVGRDVNGFEFRLALLEWRNTPRADGYSPAYGFFGRVLRTQLPDAREKKVPDDDFAAARLQGAAKQALGAGGHDLPPLAVGDRVHYRNKPDEPWCIGATVVEIMPGGRSYWVETQEGAGYRRNRQFLRPAYDVVQPAPPVVVEAPAPGLAALPLLPPALRRSARVKVLAKRARHVRFDV
jgi:hypothetical protein